MGTPCARRTVSHCLSLLLFTELKEEKPVPRNQRYLTGEAAAEAYIRKRLRQTYPALERVIDQLARSGFFGPRQMFVDSLIEVAREQALLLMRGPNPMIRFPEPKPPPEKKKPRRR